MTAIIQMATDLDMSSVADGNTLVYNATTKMWVSSAAKAGPINASSLTLAGPQVVKSGTLAIAATVIAAAGSTQLGATLITSHKVFVTASVSTEGVLLPVWATGLEVDILNVGTTHKTKVWPNVNAKISSGASNAVDATLLAAFKNTTYKAVLTNTWVAERSA